MLRRRYRGFNIADGGLDTPAYFPVGIVPSIWFDGRLPMYTDTAGSALAGVGSLVGRSNEQAPLTSNWQAPTNGQRARKDSASARFDYFGAVNPGQSLAHISTPAIDVTNCTLFFSLMPRDSSQSPQIGLLRASSFGLYTGNGQPALTYNSGGANWGANVPFLQKGTRSTLVARYAPSGLKMLHMLGGVMSSDSLVTAITGSPNSNPWIISEGNGANNGLYGSVSQAGVINRALSDAETISLATWCDAQTLPVGFPTDAILFGVIGDSIARCNPGTQQNGAWCWNALGNARSTYPTCEMVNCAIGGAGVEIGMYTPVIPFYSPQRARNILIVACGTNTLAVGNGQTYCRDTLFATCDIARAAGWRLALATILDRTGSLSIAQGAFDSQRAFVNAAILGSVGVHCDAVIDMTTVPLLSANGAANNATYFGDQIHPTAAGHALMEPVYRAAMLALAA